MARSFGASPILLSALLACACAGPSGAGFPIGIYHVDDPGALKDLAAAGFNAIETPRYEPETLVALGKEARRRGMSLFISPRGLMNSSAPISGLPVLAWYLWDEPELTQTSPQTLQALRDDVKRWDARPVGITIGTADAADTYKDIPDILAIDWYPVPHLPLRSLGDHVARVVEAVGRDKPVWAVVQAMDWRDFPEGQKKGIGRFPTIYEMRFMAYDAVSQGARGLWFFTYSRPSGKNIRDFPEQWLALRKVVRELSQIKGLFVAGKRCPLPFPPDPDSVESRAWRWRGRTYVLIQNRKADRMQRIPEEMLKASWRPLFEPHRDARRLLTNRSGAWYLQPHRTLLFESVLGSRM